MKGTLASFVLAALCLVPGVTRAEHVELRLAWPDAHAAGAPLAGEAAPAVLAASIRSGTPLQRSEPASDSDLVIVGLDAAGRERYRVAVPDPSILHAELFDPATGQIQESRDVHRTIAELPLTLPQVAAVRRLALYRPHFTGGAYTLEPLAQVPLPAPSRGAQSAASEQAALDASVIIHNGEPSNRVDIVFLGDGYTAAELPKYYDDVQNVLNGFFGFEPYATYAGFFNVYVIPLISNQSGADHPGETALDSTFACEGVERLLCANNAKIFTAASVLPIEARDLVITLVNDPRYGGSGSPPVISTHPSIVNLGLHETAHNFASLADEYVDPNVPCSLLEPAERNVTTITSRFSIKWQHWIGLLTPIPTPESFGNVPGLYLGGRYCASGMYRPTPSSMMRTLGDPFYAVNEELIVQRIYDSVRPIDSFSPNTSDVTLARGQSMTFSIAAPFAVGVTIEVSWSVNGVPRQSGTNYSFTLSDRDLRPGRNTLQAFVRDTTPKVIQDRNNTLSQTQTWMVTLGR